MTEKQAIKINGEMCQWHFHHMQLSPKPETELNYSLAEMLKASEIVKKRNNKAKKNKPNGARTHYMTCDDRLIAALYVVANYESSRESICCCNGKYLFITN